MKNKCMIMLVCIAIMLGTTSVNAYTPSNKQFTITTNNFTCKIEASAPYWYWNNSDGSIKGILLKCTDLDTFLLPYGDYSLILTFVPSVETIVNETIKKYSNFYGDILTDYNNCSVYLKAYESMDNKCRSEAGSERDCYQAFVNTQKINDEFVEKNKTVFAMFDMEKLRLQNECNNQISEEELETQRITNNLNTCNSDKLTIENTAKQKMNDERLMYVGIGFVIGIIAFQYYVKRKESQVKEAGGSGLSQRFL